MRWKRKPMDLGATVQAVADCPCDKHQTEFTEAVRATDELFFVLAPGSTTTPPHKTHEVSRDDDLRLPVSTVQGRQLIHGFTDLSAAQERSGGGTVVGIPTQQVLSMVVGSGLDGLLLSNSNINDASAGITTQGARDLLDR